MSDRFRVLGLVVGGGVGHSARAALTWPARAARRFRVPVPERLLIAPQDIRTGDPTVATDIGEGYFSFAGKHVSVGARSPFLVEVASEAWARQLHGFGWLRHLRAAGDPRLKARGRALVVAFLDAFAGSRRGPAWDAAVAARRMIAWLSQSPIILEGSDRAFYGRFMEALAVTRLHLEQGLAAGLAGDDRLFVALALTEFALCAPGSGSFQRQSSDLLSAEITAQILGDGGHVSRDPQILIDLLLDLLPLRQAFAARGIAVPPPILNAIDRMMPMLRLLRHGDGSVALFNGMSLTAPEMIATILAYDDARAQPPLNAPYSGYQRMEAGGRVVIVEAGVVPPRPFSARAHAGCLSFELSSGSQRLVVNCGAPEVSRANAQQAARVTAAHSTLVLDDTSSCRFAAQTGLQRWLGDQILAGPTLTNVERLQEEGFTTLKMAHDGYKARFGWTHARDLSLSSDGTRLEGRDALERAGNRPIGAASFALRFHLHPSVAARVVGGGTAVLLDCADGDQWLFQADAPVTVEPSVLFAASGGPRPTLQIRVAANSAEREVVHWAFRRRPADLDRSF